MVIHGHARIDSTGKAWLGFVVDAPIFKQRGLGAQFRYTLKEASATEPVVGYSVVRVGQAAGFLWYPKDVETAQAQARKFTDLFKTEYVCITLTLA